MKAATLRSPLVLEINQAQVKDETDWGGGLFVCDSTQPWIARVRLTDKQAIASDPAVCSQLARQQKKPMTNPTYAERRALAESLCDFFRCPTTGRVLDGLKHDDKVICGCGKTNPVVAARGHREAPGVHIKTYLERATADEWIKQEEERRA